MGKRSVTHRAKGRRLSRSYLSPHVTLFKRFPHTGRRTKAPAKKEEKYVENIDEIKDIIDQTSSAKLLAINVILIRANRFR